MNGALLDDVAERILLATRSQAGQVVTVVGNELTSVAFGTTSDGEPYRASHVAPAYCMSRIPLMGTLLTLVSDGFICPDSPVSRYASIPYINASATILDVTDHRAGLMKPDILTWRMTAPAQRNALLPNAPGPRAFGYSDLLSCLVVSAIIEAVAGAPIEEVVQECLIRPACAAHHIRYSIEGVEVHPAVAGLPNTVVPLLSERLPDQLADVTPATGVYASAEGIARILAWLFIDGPNANDRSRRVIGATRPLEWDPVLGRRASYSYGFMSDLASHGLDKASGASFGHMGAIAGWVAAVEPNKQTVQVGYANGVLKSAHDGWRVRNILMDATCGDWDRISIDTGGPTVETTILGPRCAPPLDGFAGLVKAKVLPTNCSFTVDVHLTDTGAHARLHFDGGALRGFHDPTAGAAADLSLRAERTVMEAWLHSPSSRLGTLICNGQLKADGALWFLSALEYWAATTAHTAS